MVTKQGALIADAICAAGTVFILLLRLSSTIHLRRALDFSCALVGASIVICISRSVVDSKYLLDSNSGEYIDHDSDSAGSLTRQQLAKIKTGSILVTVARILVTTFYWLQVALLLLFYSNLLEGSHKFGKRAIPAAWAFLLLSYVAVALATCLECRPFHLYWQITPSPSQCDKAYIQLFAQGVSNIILDLMLLGISFPVLTVKSHSKAQKMRIALLYFLSFLCIVITAVRVAITESTHSSQEVRSLWASIQEIVSAFVANTPTIYGNARLIGRKRKESKTQPVNRTELWVQLRGSGTTEIQVQEVSPWETESIIVMQPQHKSELNNQAWTQYVP